VPGRRSYQPRRRGESPRVRRARQRAQTTSPPTIVESGRTPRRTARSARWPGARRPRSPRPSTPAGTRLRHHGGLGEPAERREPLHDPRSTPVPAEQLPVGLRCGGGIMPLTSAMRRGPRRGR
jgi:hypothetical protein